MLHGPNIKIQMDFPSTQAASSIAQLLEINGVKHRQQHKRSTSPAGIKMQEHPAVRHATSQETPVAICIGLMLHLSAGKRNWECQLFQEEQVVCLLTMHGSVFTTAAVNYIDHNPSSTAAKDSTPNVCRWRSGAWDCYHWWTCCIKDC